MIDVAQAAGVSQITLSRAINRPELVSAATRAHVLEFVRKMGYVPDLLTGSPSTSKSKLVAILPYISHCIFATAVQVMMDRLTKEPLTINGGLL